MAGGRPLESVLVAPGVKGKKVLAFKRDGLKKNEAVTGLIHDIVASSSARSAFHVLDLAKVVDLYAGWRRALPGVRPFYAVKCNPDTALLGALAALGAGFDCASRAEIEAVLALGVPPAAIVYANPCKPGAHVAFAAEAGVNVTTYDSEEEVAKVKRCHPSCELLLRIKAPDCGGVKVRPRPQVPRATRNKVLPLLRAAPPRGPRRGRRVVPRRQRRVPRGRLPRRHRGRARGVQRAAGLGMPPMRVLNIAGGFPGRYFAETAFTLAARVIGKRRRGDVREYWIDDGVYGSLNCILLDSYVPRPRPLAGARPGEETHASTVFGPTCDSIDTVVTGYQLPEMSVDDWLVFDDMGAYTTAAGSSFNGFATSAINTYLAYSS
ncbi:Os04g0136500 [Oryza sativa Japonica Group]|uniref:ornithine decarboxylase n=1 Tax=Oryza sativa subsp. japonica TaxID=39947 RepID=Q0JF73_ORYSJ|nr:Os04g0136500 [Oryza sativa Japonica Group]|eukprot:NP_001052100.2 Os04g0136500 [Oryza sativa Japonica Group]